MAIVMQLRRGTTAEANAFTGAEGELFIDVDNKLLYLHDGTTQGGYLINDDDTTNTITSGSLSGNTITFTREDATQFTVDVSSLYDDTNLVTSVAGQTGAVTLTESDISDLQDYALSTEEVYTLTGTEISFTNGTIQNKTVSANTTFTETLSSGQSVVLMLAGAESYTITWPTITWVSATGNVAPTLTANDVIVMWKVGTTLYGLWSGSSATA